MYVTIFNQFSLFLLKVGVGISNAISDRNGLLWANQTKAEHEIKDPCRWFTLALCLMCLVLSMVSCKDFTFHKIFMESWLLLVVLCIVSYKDLIFFQEFNGILHSMFCFMHLKL